MTLVSLYKFILLLNQLSPQHPIAYLLTPNSDRPSTPKTRSPISPSNNDRTLNTHKPDRLFPPIK
ncbi:MAG: hypothetical protein M1G31_05090 [Pseudanabaena sp. Salubria-1]|nr:hypothetical protein [Pseudanabaena sp. Salubria-1]